MHVGIKSIINVRLYASEAAFSLDLGRLNRKRERQQKSVSLVVQAESLSRGQDRR